jgi:hypothetical protein
LGLSRQYNPGNKVYCELFLKFSKNSEVISKEMISFYFDNSGGTSHADFGDYSLDSVKGNSEDNIAWINMPDESFYWYSAAVQAVKIGDDEFTNQKRTASYSYGPD